MFNFRNCLILILILNSFNLNCKKETENSDLICTRNKDSNDPEYDSVMKNLMDTWTKIDLVRAINTTSQEREEIAKDLVEKIILVYPQLLSIVKQDSYEDLALCNLFTLIQAIRNSFKEIFYVPKSSDAAITASFILNRSLNLLKKCEPNSITQSQDPNYFLACLC